MPVMPGSEGTGDYVVSLGQPALHETLSQRKKGKKADRHVAGRKGGWLVSSVNRVTDTT